MLGYGILKQVESSLFKFLSDETIGEIKLKWKHQAGDEAVEMTEGEVWDWITPKDFRRMVLGNVDFGLETMAKMIRTLNGESIGTNYEERYDFVLGMDENDGREISNVLSDRVASFSKGAARKGESGPSTVMLTTGVEKVRVPPVP